MRSRSAVLGLLTLSAALSLFADTSGIVSPVTTRDQKVVRRWKIDGEPRGVALGSGNTIYVGLADRQSVLAINGQTGAVIKEVVLDHAEIAATKDLVTMRTNAKRDRLYIANGSDESATILSIPSLAVVREITMEGETIRDAVPDPKGKFLFLLGRRVHVFDANGESEIHTIDFEDPMAIAINSSGTMLAVAGSEDFGNAKATVIATYDTATFKETSREPLQTDKTVEALLFAAADRAIVALAREHIFEKPIVTRKNTVAQISEGAKVQMRVNIGDIVNSDRVCLPEKSGPQIATLGRESDHLIYAERRCSVSGNVAGSDRRVTPASLYGVNAYALVYDRETNMLVATDPAGFVTVYKAPRPLAP